MYNPFLPEHRDNPYPLYHRIREVEPVHQFKTFKGSQWLLTRYEDVRKQMSSRNFVVDDLPEQVQAKSAFSNTQSNYEELLSCIKHWLFFNEPGEHTRLRSVFGKHFTSNAIQLLRNEVKAHVETLLLPKIHQGHFDVIADVAFKLPTITMTGILGLPPHQSEHISEWSTDLFRILVPPQSIESLDRMDALISDFEAFFEPWLEGQSCKLSSGLLLQIILAQREGMISKVEMYALCIMLYSVGQETTENLIGNGILALLQHPEQWLLLQENPSLVSQAVAEAARYDTPVQGIARIVSKPVEINGINLDQGERVIFALGAALRDPAQFDNPDTFDITRKNPTILPFGGGIHFCLGAYLAKLQAELVIEVLVERCERLELDINHLEWRPSILLRGVKSLPVKCLARRSIESRSLERQFVSA